MAGVKEAIKAMADAAVAVAEAQEVLGALYEVRDRLDAQKARVDHLYDSTVTSLDSLSPGVVEAILLDTSEEDS
jgi:hypothetical protein